MTRRTARWYAALLADPDLPDAARVLGMDLVHSGAINERTGHFTCDMDQLGQRLNRHPTRIKERRAALRNAGYVDLIVGHAPGRAAVWAIVVPLRRGASPSGRRVRSQPKVTRSGEPGPMEGDLGGVAE